MKVKRLKHLATQKKNSLVFKTTLINSKVLDKHKVLPYFLIVNKNFNSLKKSNEAAKLFWKLKQYYKLNHPIPWTLPSPYSQITLALPNYLLTARINFFTTKITLVGSLCWLWFFDIYENLNSTVESQALKTTLSDNIELYTHQARYKRRQHTTSGRKPKLNFLSRKHLIKIKGKRRNISKFIKLLKVFNWDKNLDVPLVLNWLSSYKKIPQWQVRIKKPRQGNIRKRRLNPYLFLHNKSVNLRKPLRYSRELFYFSSLKKLIKANSRSLKTIFFSKKKKINVSTKLLKFFTNLTRKLLTLKLPTLQFYSKLLNTQQILSATQKKISKKINKSRVKKNYKKYILFSIKYFKKKVNYYSLPIVSKVKIRSQGKFDNKFSIKQRQDLFQKIKNAKTKHLKFRQKFKKKHPKQQVPNKNVQVLTKLRLQRKVAIQLPKQHNKRKITCKTAYAALISAFFYKKYIPKRLKKSSSQLITSRSNKLRLLPMISLTKLGLFAPKSYIFSRKLSSVLVGYTKPFFNPTQLKLDNASVTYKTVSLNSRTSKPFSFRNIGVFLWSQKKHFFKKNTILKFLFKKKIYSFLFPNDVRKSIMNRRKAFKSYRFIYKTSKFKKKKPYYSLVFFKNTYKNFFKLESLYKSLASTNSPSGYKSLSNSMTREEILYEEDFVNKGHIENLRSKEIFIRRIRFKPGYQRIWRQAREAALEHFQIRTVYQQQLTKYLTKFYRQAHYNSFMYLETTLSRTIVYMRLLPDYASVSLFHDKNFLFLNGHASPDLTMQVVPADFIQLLISNWFYIYNRWVTNTTLLRARKFKRLVYRKGMAGKYKVIKLRKQKSRYTPKWIYYSRFDHSDIKTYFEVDYFTMSAFVLYNPYIIDYSAPDDTIDLRISIYKMYNWKYIT